MEKVLNKNTITTVLYHKNCADGFGSAFCVWLYYKEQFGLEVANKIYYKGCKYQKDKMLDFTNLTGKNVLMCDFSYKCDQLIEIIKVANSFIILDHHKTALEDLANIDDNLKIFDMNRSGVGITWDYFFPNKEMPKILQLIQDRDLWLFKLKDTNEFTTYLFQQNFTFPLFESFLNEDNLNKAIETGTKWLEYKQIIVKNIAQEARQVLQIIGEKLMIVLYISNVYGLTSDVGSKVFEYFPLADFSVIYCHKPNKNITKFSLRSTNERTNVQIIAESFQGGGHRNAAGLIVPGIIITLPGKQYDIEILTLLKNKECRVNGPIAKKGIFTYILFKLDKFNFDWLEKEYYQFLKRKLPQTHNIIFLFDSQYYICRDEGYTQFPYGNDLLKIINEIRTT